MLKVDDLTNAFETYATHPDAKPGQHLLNDISDYLGSRFDDTTRLVIQSKYEPVLSIGDRIRKVLLVAPRAGARSPAETFARLWNTSPYFKVMITRTEKEAFVQLKLPYTSIAQLLRTRPSSQSGQQASNIENQARSFP